MDATKHNKEGLIVESYWENGIFYPCQVPIEMPLGYEHPESLTSMVARMVRSCIAEGAPIETEDEASDFGEEDFPLDTVHTFTEMQEEELYKEKNKAENEVRDAEEALRAESQPINKPQGETESEMPPRKPGKRLQKLVGVRPTRSNNLIITVLGDNLAKKLSLVMIYALVQTEAIASWTPTKTAGRETEGYSSSKKAPVKVGGPYASPALQAGGANTGSGGPSSGLSNAGSGVVPVVLDPVNVPNPIAIGQLRGVSVNVGPVKQKRVERRTVCQARSERKTALFALKVAGVGRKKSPGSGGTYKRSDDSQESCRRS